MNKTRNTAIAALAAMTLGVPSVGLAQGADSGVYIGGSFGQSQSKDACTGVSGAGVSCDDKDTAYRLFGGYQVSKHFAVEVGYHQFGEATANFGNFRATIEATAFDAVAVGILPVANNFSVFGKIGLYQGDTEFTSNIPGVTNESKSNTDLTFGLGVQFDLAKNFAIRAEYQKFQDMGGGNIGEVDIDVMSIGALFRF
jgi:OmpA-OmpF porin, OOP family